VNDLFAVTLRDTPAGVRLAWEMKKDREAWRDLRERASMLRTNLQADSAERTWSVSMQLTEAEASFRGLESELSIRPLFHQKGAAGEGPCPSGLSRLCIVGDAEASAPASAGDRPTTLGPRRGPCSALSPMKALGERSACAGSPHRRRTETPHCTNSVCIYLSSFRSIENVV
jgi:hypothetical protein